MVVLHICNIPVEIIDFYTRGMGWLKMAVNHNYGISTGNSSYKEMRVSNVHVYGRVLFCGFLDISHLSVFPSHCPASRKNTRKKKNSGFKGLAKTKQIPSLVYLVSVYMTAAFELILCRSIRFHQSRRSS